MLDFSNREIATAIWIGLIVAVLLVVPEFRRHMWPSIKGLFEAIANWKILVPVGVYFAYIIGVFYGIWRAGLWHLGLLTETLIIAVFAGLPIFFSAHQVVEGKRLLRDVLVRTLGLSAFVVFYVGLEPLPLWGELALQPVLLLLAILLVVAEHNPEHRPVAKLINGVLGLVGLGLIIYTTKTIISQWALRDGVRALEGLALAVGLLLALVPLVYVFAFIMHVENILTQLSVLNGRKKPKLVVRLACLLGLHFGVKYAADFNGNWRADLAQAGGLRESHKIMKDFRRAVRQRDRAAREYKSRTKQMSGVDGIDQDGLQLDRREFHETKRSLDSLLYGRMGRYRNVLHEYDPSLPIEICVRDLPAEHGITMTVRSDRQAWRAWRRAPNGYIFGVGGTSNIDSVWQYDGAEPPISFPSEESVGWVDAENGISSPEWAYDDEPPTRP